MTVKRKTRTVMVGNVALGSEHPIRVQTMTATDTKDAAATVEQVMRIADKGADIIRITVQGALHRHPDAMKNIQGFPHYERVWVKKLVKESRIRLATWNIGTLTDKSIELVDTMKRMRVNIIYPQETK